MQQLTCPPLTLDVVFELHFSWKVLDIAMARTIRALTVWRIKVFACAIGFGAYMALSAANIRDSEELARKTPVVYVGVVTKVKQIERTQTHLLKEATISVSFVARGDGDVTQANFPYLSYDNKTPPMDGGPQYVLVPGTWVLVFASTFDGVGDRDAPHYMRQGSHDELKGLATRLAEDLSRMTPQDLELNEISESDRAFQAAMYQRLLDYFR